MLAAMGAFGVSREVAGVNDRTCLASLSVVALVEIKDDEGGGGSVFSLCHRWEV